MDEKTLKDAVASLVKAKDYAAFAALMVEYIDANHVPADIMNLILPSRSMNEGDVLVKKIRRGIKVRTLVPGRIHLASELTVSDRLNYALDMADVKVTVNQWELESGELGTVESIKSEMELKLRDYYLNRVFLALSTVWSAVNTPSNYVSVGGPLTATALKSAIDTVNQTTSGVKAVVGTRAALTPITTFGAGWSDGTSSFLHSVPENISEIMQTGWLGRYYGAPIIALNQVYDNPEDYNALLPTDKVLVIGENVGEFITYGEVRTKDYDDMRPTPPQHYFELYQKWGMIIDRADGIVVLDNVS
jgi:hypothetical protein